MDADTTTPHDEGGQGSIVPPPARINGRPLKGPPALAKDSTTCRTQHPNWRQRTREFVLALLDSTSWTLFMTLITLCSLLIDDIQASSFSKGSDGAFGLIALFIFIVFAIEFVSLSAARPGYMLSFFFFLDLLSTVAMLPQIPLISQHMQLLPGGDSSSNLVLIRAARASRAGTRAARLLRISRIVRVLRVGRLYKIIMERMKPPSSRQERRLTTRRRSSFRADDKGEQTKVGARLSELTTQRLAVIVLFMLFMIPIVEYRSDPVSPIVAMNQLMAVSNDPLASAQQFSETFESFVGFSDTHGVQDWDVLMLKISGTTHSSSYLSEQLQYHRVSEISSYYIDDGNESMFSDRIRSQKNALLSIAQTIFVIVILGIGAFIFSHDARELVIQPIERMTGIIDRLRRNPLAKSAGSTSGENKTDMMETGILEHTLEKLTALLQIGFGEAGSTMIQKNINAKGELDPMVDGQRVLAIFGFCTIRSFTLINERLKEDIMLFVNEVAEMVHTEVHKTGGTINRNLGESFLVVWKIPQTMDPHAMLSLLNRQCDLDSDFSALPDLSHNERKAVLESQNLTVQALAAFIRVIWSCANPLSRLEEMIERPALSDIFPNKQIPVSCGLHIGWAIEGAIGSRFKIDASYLSPNVNTAARLMAATKQYGVPLLFSNLLWSMLVRSARPKCRLIDRIAVKGSNVPIGIYTFDMNPALVGRGPGSSTTLDLISMSRVAVERRRQQHRENAGGRHSVDFDKDKLLSALQVGMVARAFLEQHSSGVQAYLQGDWPEAQRRLRLSLRFKPNDGPTENLLAFMAESEGTPPKDWAGFRALQSK